MYGGGTTKSLLPSRNGDRGKDIVLSKPGARRYLLKSSGKIQAKTPQEVKTTPSRNDLDLVEGLPLGMIWTWWRDSKGRAEPFTRQSCRDPQESPTHSRRVQPPDASPLRASPPCGPSTTPVEGSARGLQTTPSRKKQEMNPTGMGF